MDKGSRRTVAVCRGTGFAPEYGGNRKDTGDSGCHQVYSKSLKNLYLGDVKIICQWLEDSTVDITVGYRNVALNE